MARPLRVEFEDAIYHLCGRRNARQAIFHDSRDRARFVELLSESAQRSNAAILCFERGDVDDLGERYQVAARDWRSFRRVSQDVSAAGCRRGAPRRRVNHWSGDVNERLPKGPLKYLILQVFLRI